MKVVAVVSGGMDSVTLAHSLRAEGHDLALLSVDYGQRHARELACAAACAARLGVPHRVADLRALAPLLGGSSLTDPAVPVPEGHYAAESMKATVVPNRNMILLAVAAGWAISRGAEAVAIGAHAGDHAIYPDCRPEFADAMDRALSLCDWSPVRVLRPFIGETKAGIAALGARLGVPWAETWSCYKGGDAHCGRCGTCVERREAFELAGVPDPTRYDVAEAA
jgi:7-cyano-7-deazaguanine synthase